MRDVVAGSHAQMYDKLVIVDCRYDFEYRGGHIRGAVNLQSEELSRFFFDEFEGDGKSTVVVFYCEWIWIFVWIFVHFLF